MGSGDSRAPTPTLPPPRLLPRNFSYNTFTPPPSTPTLGEPSDPWKTTTSTHTNNNSVAPSRARTPDLAGINERFEGYPIMDAVDPARGEETVGLIKDEERGESSQGRDTRSRWSDDEFSDEGDYLSPGQSEDGASTVSAGISKVKAAQAVW